MAYKWTRKTRYVKSFRARKRLARTKREFRRRMNLKRKQNYRPHLPERR